MRVMEDAGEFEVPSLDHCTFEDVPPTAGAGETVSAGTLEAGIAERLLDVPLGASLAAFTARAEGAGAQGFLPSPDARRTFLAGSFAPSVGIETIPRIKALALRAGGETVIILKIDVASSFQGFVHDVEANLGPEYSGKVIVAASHSHSSFGNYSGHSALQVGFGSFRSTVYDAILSQLIETAQAALADLEPAQIGFHHNDAFDLDDRVNRDRREENDEIAGGTADDNHLFVLRVDRVDGSPMAVVPVFGMHGTIQDGNNAIVTTDASGGVERVVEEEFDSEVLVMHLQGTAGDVSPVGSEGTDCRGADVCTDFARAETLGLYARDAILSAYAEAGTAMQTELEIEMLTRTIPLGPDASTFAIRSGELEYMNFDTRREADGEVYGPMGEVLSPIDEFNAPFGAALCTPDMPAIVPRAEMPGTADLVDFPYRGCLRLEQVDRIFEGAIDIELEEPPLCETTRTVVSALRLGEWMIGTMPGEATTMLAEHFRGNLSPVDGARTVLLSYAQDHGGYLMVPEDWLLGGYEPTITFWGPLEGEYVAEQLAALMTLAMTPEREDGNEAGEPRVASPTIEDDVARDTSAVEIGTVPATLPDYVLTRLLRGTTSVQPAPTVERLGTVFFTFVGPDPLAGTPRVFLQREVDGVYEDVVRRSGRPVIDGDMIMTWTPDPILRREGIPRTHYFTVEFQAAAPLGTSGMTSVGERVGLPLGTYRFRVAFEADGEGYDLVSAPFEVQPLTFIETHAVTGADLEVSLSFEASEGFRLLDLETPSNQQLPLRSRTIMAEVDGADPVTLTTDDEGVVTVPGAAAAASVLLVDESGNQVTIAP